MPGLYQSPCGLGMVSGDVLAGATVCRALVQEVLAHHQDSLLVKREMRKCCISGKRRGQISGQRRSRLFLLQESGNGGYPFTASRVPWKNIKATSNTASTAVTVREVPCRPPVSGIIPLPTVKVAQ